MPLSFRRTTDANRIYAMNRQKCFICYQLFYQFCPSPTPYFKKTKSRIWPNYRDIQIVFTKRGIPQFCRSFLCLTFASCIVASYYQRFIFIFHFKVMVTYLSKYIFSICFSNQSCSLYSVTIIFTNDFTMLVDGIHVYSKCFLCSKLCS